MIYRIKVPCKNIDEWWRLKEYLKEYLKDQGIAIIYSAIPMPWDYQILNIDISDEQATIIGLKFNSNIEPDVGPSAPKVSDDEDSLIIYRTIRLPSF